MPKRARKLPAEVFQVRIELLDVTPAVWRRVLVPSDINLADLHLALNEAMGWTNSHLHHFVLRDRMFGDVTMPDADDLHLEDERKVRLEQLLGVGQVMGYEYDFGDGWEHEVKVEKVLPFDDRYAYPICVDGARACPPEDCGGAMGYERFLEILSDPKHEEHADMRRWIGGHFDPSGFDVNRTNHALQQRH